MLENLYNVIFNLYSYDQTSRNNIGGIEKTAIFKSSQSAYYTYLRGGEQYKFGKNNVVAKYRLFCQPIEVNSSDLVQIQNLWFRIVAIDPCSNFDHHLEITLKALGSQSIVVESGWTWGEEHPLIELPESWKLWTFAGTMNEATNTGAWGELEVRAVNNFVSPVKDSVWVGNKYISLSYDDYNTCGHNSGRIVSWRGSNTIFSQDDVVIPWILYSGELATSLRYLQVRCGIY